MVRCIGSLAFVVVLAAPVVAEPITVAASVGFRVQRTAQSPRNTAPTPYTRVEPGRGDLGPALALALGYRLPLATSYEVGIGLRAAFGRMSWEDRGGASGGSEWATVTRRSPLDLAVMSQITSGRWWATPWLGMQQTRVTKTEYGVRIGEPIPSDSVGRELSSATERDLAGGVTVGYDVFRTRGGSVGIAIDGEATGSYAAIGLGVAYHL